MLGPPAAYHHGVSTTPSQGSSSRLPAAPGYTQTHKEQGLIPTASCCGGGSDAALDPAPPSMPTLDATAEVCVCLPRGRSQSLLSTQTPKEGEAMSMRRCREQAVTSVAHLPTLHPSPSFSGEAVSLVSGCAHHVPLQTSCFLKVADSNTEVSL